jgi:RNA polymerase sigma-70 factor (ECF subfamily)
MNNITSTKGAPMEHKLEDEQIEQAETIHRVIMRIRNGDTEAFRTIVQLYQRRMHVYCYHMLGDKQEAEDTVQFIFMKCYESLDQFDETTSLTPWLYKVGYNQCLKLLGRRRSWLRFLQSYSSTPPSQPDKSDERIVLDEALSKLSPMDKHLVILRVVEDKSFNEIASITSVKAETLRKQFERARKKMKHIWVEEGYGDEKHCSSVRT